MIFISFAVHAVILFQNPDFNFFKSSNQKSENPEIVYFKEDLKKVQTLKITNAKREELIRPASKMMLKKTAPPPFIDTGRIFKVRQENASQEASFSKPQLERPGFIAPKPDIIAVKKKITLPPVDLGKINNPSYLTYYQIVREKIKRAAYQNYARTDAGEVYLSFVILNDGSLKEVRLQEDKSSQSAYLKEIAHRSIKEASPFPAFPKELDYPQLSFNVIISFSVE